MATLAEIRAKLQASSQNNGGSGTGGDNQIYPHWNIAEGQTATVRFLPDGDPNNTFFWIERAMIKLPFAGIKGETNSKPTQVQVPCMEMWGETCPVLTEVRPWFKDKNLEEMGRKYWKKRSYLFQGFVVDSKLQEDKTPENPIRRFIINPSVFDVIKSILLDQDLEHTPTDYEHGRDFYLVKTTKGQYANYSSSKWAMKERALTEDELGAVAQFGLYNLEQFLPKKPDDAHLKAIMEMFEASVDGQPYDADKWGQYYKPAGFGSNTTSAAAPAASDDNEDAEPAAPAAPAPKLVVSNETKTEPPFTPDAPAAPKAASSGQRAEDILAMIRNRQKK